MNRLEEREACICRLRSSRQPVICLRLICYDLDGNEGPCDEEDLDREWTAGDISGELCLGFEDGIKSDLEQATEDEQEAIIEDTGFTDVETLIAEVASCCEPLINAIVAGRCDETPEQNVCLDNAEALAPWFDDENLDEAVALREKCPPPEPPREPIQTLKEYIAEITGPLPAKPPPLPPARRPGDGRDNPIPLPGLFEGAPFIGTDGRWFVIVGGL